MNPKRYTQSSPLIQWAYLFEEFRPLQTSTCALFWRATVLTPFKILCPAIVIGMLLLTVVILPIMRYVAPEWIPTALQVPPHRNSESDYTGFWILGIGASSIAVLWIGQAIGLWNYLHRFCLPVEIEGGLVKKGVCPSCVGRLILVDETRWECQKCQGHFVPAVKEPA